MPLSRIHRPQQFKDVTGQAHVTETLRREVAQGAIGHAYLFSGPRGVGKTTSARIFAKALLCTTPKEGEPCSACAACVDVANGQCLDLIEMDAASQSGVEHVREAIIEHVRFAPARWARKIYVLDEAHMLSTSAWSALLKTLEEPPPYAVFIFATTELHKVPATILSRCQRFAFTRIPAEAMSERLQSLAVAEGVSLDADVLAALVHAADGYVRDGESLLEQLLSLGGKTITQEIAELVLPTSRIPVAAGLLTHAASRSVTKTLEALRTAVDDGVTPVVLFDDLLQVTRTLLHGEAPTGADASSQAVAALHGRFSLGELGDIALLLIERRRDARQGVDPVFALELALVTIAGGLLPHAASSSAPHSSANVSSSIHAPTMTPAPRPAAVVESRPEPAPLEKREDPTPSVHTDVPAAVIEPAPEPHPSVPITTNFSPDAPLDVHEVLLKWREIIRTVEQENRSLPFVLKIAAPESVQGDVLIIRFQYPFHYEKIIGDLKTKRILESALRSVLGREKLTVDGVVGELVGGADRTGTADIVSNVLNAFGGSVVE
ncbi:MAG: polymerase subunit gamma/tau [Candidatus Parcubacteria bacterium]|jgi:DNA polymerase-3 subunit gamma/tau